jgi:hypothetical protein
MTFFSRLRQNSTLECKGKSEQKAGISKAILENINEPSNAHILPARKVFWA